MASGLAFAGETVRLKGTVDNGGSAMVTISDDHWGGTPTRKYWWKFSDLTVRCEEGNRTARHAVTGGFEINAHFDRPGPWGIEGTTEGDPSDPAYATEVSGRLKTPRKAKGWVRVWGSEVSLEGGGQGECESGRLRWIARD
jgi:hypothetical protein